MLINVYNTLSAIIVEKLQLNITIKMNGITIQNVSKSYYKTTRKLWFRKFVEKKETDDNVSYRYYNRGFYQSRVKRVQALDKINLEIEPGEIVGLLGPNGAGKTTLAKIISSLVLPDEGNVTINGFDIVRETVNARFSLGLVTGGERSLYWKLTPYQNLRFFGSLYGLSSDETITRADELIEIFGLKTKEDILVQDLSTGFKMKTAFARSLMHDPPVLILDEYNRGMDPKASRELRLYIKKELQQEENKTMIVMTHSMDIAEDICDRIVLIDQGHIVAEGTPTALKSRLAQKQVIEIETTKSLTNGLFQDLEQFGSIDFGAESTNVIKLIVDNNPDITYRVLESIHKKGIDLKNFNLSLPNLEDVFMEYTGKTLEDS